MCRYVRVCGNIISKFLVSRFAMAFWDKGNLTAVKIFNTFGARKEERKLENCQDFLPQI